MIRFIDLRGQGTGYRFAYFDTRTDKFLVLGDEYDSCWDEFHEVEMLTGVPIDFLARLERLTPQWAKEPGEDDIDAFYDIDPHCCGDYETAE
jgi:hypothetical protein